MLLVSLAVALGAASTARAGSYAVVACQSAVGSVNNAWGYVETGPTPRLVASNGCSGVPSGELSGLSVREQLSPPDSPNTVSGYWQILAPSGTTISGINYSRFLHSYSDPDWRVELRTTGGTALESCHPVNDGDTCNLGAAGGAAQSFTGLASAGLQVGVRCAVPSPTGICAHGGTLQEVETVLYGATVTINDPQAPTANALSGSLFAGGWLRGTRSVAMSGSDETGIKSLTLSRDGGTVVRSDAKSCDYTFTRPCFTGTVGSAWADLDTSQLADGTHSFVGTVTDAADNGSATASTTVQVDNTAPAAPVNLSADGSWKPQAQRGLSWSLPSGQASPITGATVKLCDPGGACTTSAAGSTTSATVNLTTPGVWTGSVYLADEAGNTDAANASVFSLRYDPDPPAAPPSVTADSGWSSLANRSLTWSLPGNQLSPLAGATIRLCPPGGGACTTTPAAQLTSGTVALTSPGEWTGSVYLADEAGNTSPANSTAFTLRYDAGPPPAPTLGMPVQVGDTKSFDIQVTATDPGPAPLAAVDSDVCTQQGLDCTTFAQASLTNARITVPGGGTWRVRVRSIDAAGNVGAWAETAVSYAPTQMSANPSPTPTATVAATVEPSVTPSADPTPTPTPTPVIERRLPTLTVTRAVLGPLRVKVKGRLPAAATGNVSIRVRARGRQMTRSVKLVAGRFKAALALKPHMLGAKRARLRVRYAGDAAYLPRTASRRLTR